MIVAGGSGTRFGSAKQYLSIGGRRILDRSVDTARACSDGVVIVVPAADVAREGGVAGGDSRAASVANGLAAVPSDATVICVHDAARPLASEALYRAVIDAVGAGADGAVPGVAVTDTIKRVVTEGGQLTVAETLRRDELVAVQTPQAFRADVLRRAHATFDAQEATDDASMVERCGGRIVVVAGDVTNRKITVPDDVAWAEAILGAAEHR